MQQQQKQQGSILRVPGTAALEPGIQEICHLLAPRLSQPGSRFEQADWGRLLRVSRLHRAALSRVDAQERRGHAKVSRLGSGWWDQKATEAGLERVLVRCVLATADLPDSAADARRRLRGPGVFALRHRRLAPLAYVGLAPCQVLGALQHLLGVAFDGCDEMGGEDEGTAVVAAALLLTRQEDWQLSMVTAGSQPERMCLQNELVLQHRTLWPSGLNVGLNQTLACLKELGEIRRGGREHRTRLARGSLEPGRLTLADLQFEDFRRLVFDSDESGLYRCDEEARELSRLARQLRSRSSEFTQVDFDSCHRLHAMAAALSKKPLTADRLRYRRDIRECSGWWAPASGGSAAAFFNDAIANLDCLARTLTGMLAAPLPGNEASGEADEEEGSSGGDYGRLQSPGVFVLQHRSRPCWRYASPPCEDALAELRRLLHRALDGFTADACPTSDADAADLVSANGACVASALLLLSTADEWQLELFPEPDEHHRAELYNDLVLRLDSLWPRGANLGLLLDWRTLPALQDSLDRHRRETAETA